MSDTTVWISGAAYGIGAGLAQHCPYEDARIINLDRVEADDLQTIHFDLTDPTSWNNIATHFDTELANFAGERAIFLLVGHANVGGGLALRVNAQDYQQQLIASGVAPLVLGRAFLRALPEHVEGGLMIMSSGAARYRIAGQSAYGAAKAGIEQWVRVMREELRLEGRNHWIVAVRPGLVDTPSARKTATMDPQLYPRVETMRNNLANMAVDIDTAAKRIWAVLPPGPDHAVISFDEDPAGKGVR